MIPPGTLARIAKLGLTPEQANAVGEMLCEVEQATEAKASAAEEDRKRKAAARTAKWREKRVTSHNVTSRHVTHGDGYARARTRVEDNLLPLVQAGGSEEGIVSQVSNETFETIVPEKSGTCESQRKDRVELIQAVVGMWNDLASKGSLVAVKDITAKRQSAILARTEDLRKTYDYADPLEGWRKLMGLVRGSPFLRGEANGFRCDFDFVTRASSFTKIMEEKYAPTRQRPKEINFLVGRR
jgi:hypothetical protein